MSALSLRLPKSLHEQLRELAQEEGISVNQFVISSVRMFINSKQRQYVRHSCTLFANFIFEHTQFQILNAKSIAAMF